MTVTSAWADAGAVAIGSASSPTAAQLAELGTPELVSRYRFGLEMLDPRVFELSDEQLDMAFLPDAGVGRWPVRVLLGHVADCELVQTHRIRRALAEPGAMLGLWDEQAFIDAHLYQERRRPAIGGFIAVIHTMRRWQSDLLVTLDDEEWARRAMHPEQGEVSVKWLVAYTAWHMEHHLRFCQRKIDKMLGARTPETDAAVAARHAASGGGCGCGKSEGCCQGEKKDEGGTCCGGSGKGGCCREEGGA